MAYKTNVNKGREVSRAGDNFKSVSVGLMDIDQAIFYYFENVIKPVIIENGEQVKVPVIYANPERWAALQKQGYVRDHKRKVMAPLVAFRRTGFSRDETMPVDKLDPTNPQLHVHFEKQYSKENRYDKLTALKGISPKREIHAVAVPDYVSVTYDFIVWTNFTDHMNTIVEKINWSEGSYWGEPGKFRFRASIESFEDASEYEGQRKIKTSFSLNLKGYLLPDEYPPTAVNTQKFITPKQIVLNDNTDVNVMSLVGVDDEGAKTITVINNMGVAAGGGSGGGEGTTYTAGSGLSLNDANQFSITSDAIGNTFLEYDTGQHLTTTSAPLFAAISASGDISGSAASTGSFGQLVIGNGGDILLDEDQRIYFEKDKQTWIESNGANLIRLVTNNSQMLLLDHQTGNRAIFGNGTKVYIGADNAKLPDKELVVDGDISGSATSTGSFGKVEATSFSGDGTNITGVTAEWDGTHVGIGRISGSMHVSASVSTSTAIYTNNIQNGYPTSNNWQESLEGSYFNNFDETTHVSEILRFMAGIISHSIDTASPTPNTKTFASVDTNNNNLGSTANQIAGRLPQNYTALNNDTLNYLVSKGWTSVGAKVFDSISIYNDSSYFLDFDSNSGGSTTISSSADSELFGLGSLTSGGATRFDVRVIATQSFSDSAGLTTPTAVTNSFTTQSVKDYTMTSFGTTSGVTLAKIASANPAVIPAAYQDGKFENLGGTAMSGSLTRKYNVTSGSFTSISSSGYYRFHDLKVGISTGSGAFTFVNGSDTVHFFAPRAAINTAIGDNSIDDSEFAYRELTCVSRSLSGVPYVTGSTYEVSSKVTGLFNPLYAGTTTLVDFAENSVGMGSVVVTNGTISTNGGTIQTANAIYDSTGATARGTGTVPYYNDIAIVSASVQWDADNDENINQSGTGDTSFQIKVKVRDRDSDQSTVKTQGIKYHTAGAFGQHTDSGSMAVYGRAQGYDAGSLTGTSEAFSGESYRIQLLNNVTAFNGTAWDTAFAIGQLGTYDLQVKPGYLVDPGGTYRYWYPANHHSGGTYKYYIRRFQTSGTKTSMTVNVGSSLVAWDSTTSGIAVGLIFKSAASGSGGNSEQSVCRIYDPSKTNDNLIEADISNDNHKNPFSSAISLYGNTGGSLASTTYTVPIRNADGMYLDSTDNELYVIIRYKGDQTPITSISLSFS